MITLNMLKKSHKVIDNSFINTYTVNRMLCSIFYIVHRLIFGYFISMKDLFVRILYKNLKYDIIDIINIICVV